ncbi:hypothetical protein [Pararhizobium arenae]|uniref:hypothetical protein n=1 Tax=Pararhizobium arenae TaxID=1856850 RepID=UPI00117B7399|nr:hypothetical protein [Pararhizobium arenae]
MIAAVVFGALPASAYHGSEVPLVVTTAADDQLLAVHDFYKVADLVADVRVTPAENEPTPAEVRQPRILEPEYALARRTDAQNLVELRRRC